MKILLVDDNRNLREMFREILQRKFPEAEFMEASTGREATTKLNELAETEWPDIVVTDYEMPDMNGIELLSAIRDEMEAARNKIPVIVISGILDSRALEANVKRLDGVFLKKPVKSAILVEAIKGLLNR